MPGLRNQILIFEDDPTLAQSLKEAFTREGFTVYATSVVSEARDLLARQPIGTIFLDLLLPEMSGVDFAQSLRSTYNENNVEIVFMSGIFTDPGTVKEALRSAKGKAFLKKPFELVEALQLVEKPPSDLGDSTASAIIVHPRKALYQLFAKAKVSIREKRKALDALDEIHGFDLPFIYSLIVETKSSGHLNIVIDNGDVFGISFSEGHIVTVDIPDKDTYFGQLLIEQGFLDAEDLEEALNIPAGQNSRKIGEKLVQNFFISPHALDIVLLYQMHIRLSKTVIDKSVHCNFVDAEVDATMPNVDPDTFTSFLHDWIASKISADWLKAHFTQWSNSVIKKSPWYNEEALALKMPIVQSMEGVIPYLLSGKKLSDLVDDQNQYPEDALYKVIHFLLTKGLLTFENSKTGESKTDRLKMLRHLVGQFQNKNKIEIFDIMVAMSGGGSSDPDSVTREFMKYLGAQPGDDSMDLQNLWRQVQRMANEAYEAIKSGARDQLKEEMERGALENQLKASTQFEEAKNLLQKSQYRLALDLLNKSISLDATQSRIKLYLVWAKIGSSDASRPADLKQIEMDMLQIPVEEKYDAIYHFVSGLICKIKNDIPGARKQFEKTIAMDSGFIVARREMAVLSSQASSAKKDVLSQDLGALVGSFFSRRK